MSQPPIAVAVGGGHALDRAAWEAQNEALAENIVQAARRDAGRRVLAAVRCQRLHWLIPLLRAHPDEFEIVDYRKL
jgi:hypothetical protein